MRQSWLIFLLLLSITAATNAAAAMGKACLLNSTTSNSINDLNGLTPLAIKFQNSNQIKFNDAHFKPWNNYASMECNGSLTATYKRPGKQLTFVTTKQIKIPTDPFTQKELQNLEKIMSKIKPTGVLIETQDFDFMSASQLEDLKKNCYRGTSFLCDVATYTALLASETGALIQGGEPPTHILDEAVLQRISYKDLIHYKATQALLSLKRQSIPAEKWEKSFEEIMNGPMVPDSYGVNKKDVISYEDYKEFLEQEIKTTPEQIIEQSLETVNALQANALQRAAYMVDHAREPYILKKMESLVNRSDNVVVVYGPVHYYIQQEALKKVFGQPIIKCLN